MRLESSPPVARHAVTRSEAAQAPWLRRHGVFLAFLALGVAIRGVVTLAYRPALIFPDSLGYLSRAVPFQVFDTRPSGYSLFLWPFVEVTRNIGPIAAVQHLIGLGLATLCYAFLLRRGLPGWGAALAVLPLLLDPLQLVLEHYVLSDVLFEALLVGACLLVLWRRRPRVGSLVLAGAFVGCAGFVRGAGTFVLVVFVVALVCLRVHWVKVVAFALAAIIPLAAYAVDYHKTYGQYAVSTAGPRFLYARLAPIVHCDNPQLQLPPYERMLCPAKPVGQRRSTDWYMWGQHQGPGWHVHGPQGTTQLQVLKDFDKRVVRAEPVAYATAALTDLARGFSPTRTVQVPGYPASYWLFANHYWTPDTFIKRGVMHPAIRKRFGTGYGPRTAQFMATYRQWVYVPGPLMAVLVLVALGAVFGLGRARRSGDRVAVGLLTATCMITLLTSAALSGFSWRYQLPQVAMIPVAGALGLSAMVRGRTTHEQLAPPLRLLDRVAKTAGMRVVVAVVAGLLLGGLSGVVALASGWVSAPTALLGGTAVALVVVATLLVAHRRPAADPPATPDSADQPEEPGPDRLPAGR